MKQKNKLFGLFISAIIIAFTITGCIGFRFGSSGVRIRTENNLLSIIQGGHLRLSASGTSIVWSISSTRDGSGALAAGTFITQDGLLTAASNETALIIYVSAISLETDQSDTAQVRVVSVDSVNITPVNQAVALGRTFQFRASVTGRNNPDSAVTWRVSSNAAGTGSVTSGTSINNNGLLTVAANETIRTLYITATSIVNTNISGSALVNVVIPTVSNVTVSPVDQTVSAGRTLQFSAAVTGTFDPVTTVTWRVSSNAAGTGAVTPGTSINNNGLLTVSSNESLSLLYITATSTADTSRSGSTIVNVVRPSVTSVSVTPLNLTLPSGSSVQFTAAVTGTANPDTTVTWRVSSNAAGTGAVTQGTSINNNGLLTIAANETITTLYVFATSVFDTTKSGSVLVNVTPQLTQPPPTRPPTQPPAEQPPTRPPVTRPPAEQTPAQPPAQPPVEQPAPPVPVISGVIVNPSTPQANRGSTIQFTAQVESYTNPNPPISWRVGTNPNGTGAVSSGTSITGNGLLRIGANETAAILYVVATFNPDTSRFGSAVVTVRAN